MEETSTPTETPAAAPVKAAKPKLKALVERDACTGCEYCVHWCPVPACLELKGGERAEGVLTIVHINMDTCIGCKQCELYCPYDAIHIHKLTTEEIEKATPLQGIIDQPYSEGVL